ncbi:hypothetical protein AAFN47_02000 [Hoeflea sp. CAU 1731]
MADDTEKLIVKLEARIRDFEKNFDKAQRTANKNFAAIERRADTNARRLQATMSKAALGVQSAFKGIALGAIGGGSLVGLTRQVTDTISELSQMGKVMDRIGLNAKAFQELQFGFQLAGVSQSEFVRGMEAFAKRLGEASMGTGVLSDILEANGVSIKNQAGEFKSTEALLREYAELIRNAGSEQEMMTLATNAFGRGGASFVNALKNGEQGLVAMEKATADAGGTIDEELIRKAEILDDKWASAWRGFEVNAKSAIVSVVDSFDSLESKLGNFGNNKFFKWLAERTGASDAVFVPGEGVYQPGDELSANGRVAQAFSGQQQQADKELVAALKQRYGEALDTAKQTVLPTTGEGGSKNDAAKAALKLAEDYANILEGGRQFVAEQQLEQQALSMTAMQASALRFEYDLLNQARQHGIDLSPAQRDELAQLAQVMATVENATAKAVQSQEQLQQAGDFLKSSVTGVFSDLVTGASSVEDSLERLLNQLLEVALQAALLGQGPLAGLTGGGGLLGGMFSAIGLSGGGYVKGKGTSTSDSIPARLSDGEFVVRAAVAKKHRGLLENLNAGKLPGYSQGGLVGARPLTSSSFGGGGQNIQINSPITVNGSAGTPEQNANLAKQMRRELEGSMRGIVTSELRAQMRPGAMLGR